MHVDTSRLEFPASAAAARPSIVRYPRSWRRRPAPLPRPDGEVAAEECAMFIMLVKPLRRQHHRNDRHFRFELHVHERVDDAGGHELMTIYPSVHHEARRHDRGVAGRISPAVFASSGISNAPGTSKHSTCLRLKPRSLMLSRKPPAIDRRYRDATRLDEGDAASLGPCSDSLHLPKTAAESGRAKRHPPHAIARWTRKARQRHYAGPLKWRRSHPTAFKIS